MPRSTGQGNTKVTVPPSGIRVGVASCLFPLPARGAVFPRTTRVPERGEACALLNVTQIGVTRSNTAAPPQPNPAEMSTEAQPAKET